MFAVYEVHFGLLKMIVQRKIRDTFINVAGHLRKKYSEANYYFYMQPGKSNHEYEHN